MRRALVLSALALASASLLGSCGGAESDDRAGARPGSGGPDASGGNHLQAKVVSLLPSFTEIVVALGCADRLVGCTTYGRPGKKYEEHITRVPWQGTAALEPILKLRPTLVLRQTPRDGADPLHRALERAGIRVVAVPSETIADVFTAIDTIGRELDASARASSLAKSLRASLQQTRDDIADRPLRKVLFVIGRDSGQAANIQSAGRGTFIDELLNHVRAQNVVAHRREAYPRVELEQLVRFAPDVIIDNLPPEKDPMSAWRRIRHVPAIANGDVHFVNDASLLVPGPRIGDAVRRLAEMVHGKR